MLLTGKAKKDFEAWVCRPNDPQYVKEMHIDLMYGKSYIELYAYIVEFFDSVGIHIDVFWSSGNFVFNIYNNNEKGKFTLACDTRQEATKYAILKSNHTYNNR